MAKVGVSHPCYKKEGEAKGKVLARAIKVSATAESNSVDLYADNGIAESDKSFKQGSKITLNVDDLTPEVEADLLGHTYTAEDGMVAAIGDTAPFVKLGFYATGIRKNVKTYIAKVYHKVQFGEPNDENETKGETTAFQTPTLEGSFYSDDAGEWKTVKEFDTEAAAKAFVETECAIA